MKIVCIDNKFQELTNGKIYNTLKNIRVTCDSDRNEDDYDAYVLVDDEGESHAFLADIFVSLKEYRKMKLKKLSDESIM
jgi:hypothetical protein